MPATRAFGPDDYPELRTDEEREAERAEVTRQVDSLMLMATSPPDRRRAVDRLQNRRRDDPRRLQFESVEREGKPDLLVAATSVVARGVDLTEAFQAQLRSQLGISCTADDRAVIRLDVPSGRSLPNGILGLVRSMCGCGAPIRLNHLVPLAGWMKGAGGPEPSAGARPFPAVQYRAAVDPPIVAVLDTGVSVEERKDSYLAMAVDPADRDPLDDFPPDGKLDAGAGHGAFVAGVLQQVAPGVEVHIHRVLDSDGITSEDEVADRMRAAVKKGATILNMSLGTETLDDDDPPDALRAVVAELARDRPDVLIVCAAGNGASTERVWPAAFASTIDNVVAVAALDPVGNGAPWSSHGDWVTCSAIGEGVVSTYVEGIEDGELIGDPNPDTYGPNAWATWSGTSFATPQISGAIARICSEMALSPRDALTELLRRGTKIKDYGSALRILPGT